MPQLDHLDDVQLNWGRQLGWGGCTAGRAACGEAGGRWLDRDTNPCLDFQRIGESIQRPLELCSCEGLEALPPVGKEYQQGYKLVNDRLPKGRQRLHRAADYRRAHKPQRHKIVPDQLQLPSTVEGVQLATAASVTFGQLRAIAASLDSTPLQNCIAAARNYHPDPERQVEKAMVNVGTLLADQVQGRIATEVDPRLANDKGEEESRGRQKRRDGMVLKARALLSLYREAGLPRDRLLFRLPATWAGVQAARQLESANIPTQLQVHSLVQGAAAAQAGVSVISVNVGRTREWYARHPGAIRDPQGPRQDAGGLSGPDPGVALACDVYNYVKAYHQRTQVMASGLRTREDAEALAGCDFLLLPGSVIQALAATPTAAGYNDGWRAGGPGGEEEEEPGLRARLSPEAAKAAAPAEMEQLTEALFRERLGQAGSELLARALKDSVESVDALGSLARATTGRSST
ncbi:hypothetical protein QJQ45_004417 [Haematococcus lacustris]|nr:hypothetical protein QJQ45_004417 [Haematococcus lacustris]